MKTVTQIFGTNGAGKTTLLRNLAASDPLSRLLPAPPELTLVPSIDAVLIGDYLDRRRSTAGVDRLPNKATILKTLDLAIAVGTSRIMLEGIICMTRQYHYEYLARGLDTCYVFLLPSVDTCLDRVLSRSGKVLSDLRGNGRIIRDREAAVSALFEWALTLVPQKGQNFQVVRLDAEGPADLVLMDYLKLTQ